MRHYLKCVACLALMAGLASAGTVTRWTGLMDSDWTNGANWDAGSPSPGYVAAILDVTRNPVMLDKGTNVDGLETGAANSLTLALAGTLRTGALTNAGTITLAGGALTLVGAGPFTSSGTIQTAAGHLSPLGGNITNTGTISIANYSGLQFTGGSTYANNGLITLNASGSGSSDLRLAGGGAVTLAGSGSLAMSNSTGNRIYADTPGMTLLNAAGHTISGAGMIGAAGSPFTFQNAGTVTASGSAGMVFTPTATLVNTGLIRAAGGPLTFLNGAANTLGTIRADGSTVSFSGGLVSGGTLDVVNGGAMALNSNVSGTTLQVASGAGATLAAATYNGGSINVQGTLTLQSAEVAGGTVVNSGTIQTATGYRSALGGSVTNTGTISVADYSGLRFTGGSAYANNGLITLNAGAYGVSDLGLAGGGTVTLAGSGSLAMSNSTGNRIYADNPGMTLLNAAGHTISGAGMIGTGGSPLTFQNAGTVTASGSSGMVFHTAATLVNTGLIRAAGGPLTFLNGAANTGGTIRADGSAASFDGGRISGGTLDVINGGSMALNSTNISDAALQIASGAGATLIGATYTGGSINVQGTLTLQSVTVAGGTVANSGLIQNAMGGMSSLGGSVTNTGTIDVADSSGLQFTGGSAYANNGLITLNAAGGSSDLRLAGGGTVTLSGGGSLAMSNSAGNHISADTPGMTLVNAAGHTISGAGVIGGSGAAFSFQNAGTVAATGGGIVLGSAVTFANFANQTLTGGTYNIAATFQFTGADIVTNAANITLDGPGARIVDHAGNSGIRNFANNTGSFAALNGAVLPTLGAFTNSGAMVIGSGVTLAASGYRQTAGSTVLNGTLAAPVTLEAGSLSGAGTIDGSLVNAGGTIDPGNSPGPLYIAGDLEQRLAGILNLVLTPTGFDQLLIGGAATLGGTLNILLADGFLPTHGQSFSILQFASRGGTQFATANLPNPWSRLLYLDNEVLFQYQTPEPASWLLLAGGLGWMLRRRRPAASR